MSSPASSPHYVVKTAFIVVAVLVFGLLVWKLTEVWVLVFAAILFAIILRSIASQIEDHTPVPSPWSLVLAIAMMALLGAVFVLLLGLQIKEQFVNLFEQLPQYVANIGDQLGIEDLEQQVAEEMEAAQPQGLSF